MAANYGQIIGGIASAAPAFISGISQINQSKDLLNQIQAQGVDKNSPELQTAYDYAKGQLGKGFSAGEETNFKQALADKEKAAYQAAMINSGGNQSQAIWAAINAKKFGALNDFYGANANLKRQNFGQFAGLAGALAANENTKQQFFNQKQIAAGQGLAAGRYNAYNAATSMGNFIKSWFSPKDNSVADAKVDNETDPNFIGPPNEG